MKFSESWLREWVNPEVSTETLLEQLTMAGLEVDSVEPAAPAFENVVIGEIMEVEPHPDADRLRITRVEAGESELLTIVTNVADIAVGEKIAVAKVGCVLPDGMKIKRAKLRGVESFGMFCSMGTLGLLEESDALERFSADTVPGINIRDLLGLDDQVIEVDLTPNRGDCLSLSGVAREVGVINKSGVKAVEFDLAAVGSDKTFPVVVEDSNGCPRYLGRVVDGVNPAAETPLWMQERLRRGGLRSLGPLVDITNYVMLEMGQPMHAFDLSRLSGGVVVRSARSGETMTLLDGKEIKLNEDTLLIADDNGPLALAGIMGGEQSGVADETTDIFLECAFFAPLAIAGKARSYGLHTDSSHRFERGVDSQLQQRAMERATQLIVDIAGGVAGAVQEVVDSAALPQTETIILRKDRLQRTLGLTLSTDEVTETLTGLGLAVELQEGGWKVASPSWRFDLSIEADLIEEVGRIYGYDRLPSTHPELSAEIRKNPESKIALRNIRETLVDHGYHEVITYSFVDPEMQKVLDPEVEALALANPISNDLSVMRTTLWPGLLQSLGFNAKRQQSQVRLFETGLSFVPSEDGLRQKRKIAGLIYGESSPEQWGTSGEAVDFFDMKGDLSPLLDPLDSAEHPLRFVAAEHPVLHPGKSARVMVGDRAIGWMGAIHPGVAVRLSLSKGIFLFEFDLDSLQEGSIPGFEQLSKFPMIRRDIALLVDQDLSAQSLMDTVVESVSRDLLSELRLFDLYQGDNLAAGQKSLAIGIFLQHREKTLTDEDVEEVVGLVVERLKLVHGAKLRD
ncbi:MAG: phenylalanine--tRNA ligase subunit beta [Gammaproteobacteria bacterium]|uniref:Phenylalanine--tRNA ligase beta subunit n=1 Tax=Candidatus Thiopontia autotrophica TaxID=2841688 RepID=A0A8J6TSF7_9GAMM|nr:phenylalanine--tRNA ligase subunit beta [Candidatus Thiopontia autotrophica]MBL6968933.1 phenylalanine--tRNA ligase subunit beta [Gammaproteobacteria bacterium]